MAEPQSPPDGRMKIGIAVGLGLVVLGIGWRVCSKDEGTPGSAGGSPSASAASASGEGAVVSGSAGFSAPIAAAHLHGSPVDDVIVAGLDVAAKSIRVQRINAKDEVVADRVTLADVAWSTDADLKIVASSEGVALTWRGMRSGKLVRQLVVLGPDLAPKGEPVEVAAASCATREGLWFSDGAHAISRPWGGPSQKIALPKDKDISLLCGPHRAFAVLDEDDRTSILTLGSSGPAIEAGAAPGASPVTMVRENDFGEDEQRELNEYTVGEDVGVVRLARSGAIAVREIVAGTLGPTRKLKTTIPQDDDVVAVDASPGLLVIVYTQDASAACPPGPGGPGDSVVSTKVMALRVDRQSFDESTAELSPGRCGFEVGPFYSGVLAEDVSIAWVERAGGAGRSRAPVVGLAHARVAKGGTPALARVEQAADALVDAGCDGKACYAAALARREGMDAMAPGFAKILRYK